MRGHDRISAITRFIDNGLLPHFGLPRTLPGGGNIGAGQRPAELGELEISVTPRGLVTPELAAQFAQAGVHRLVLLAPPTADGSAQVIQAGTTAISGL